MHHRQAPGFVEPMLLAAGRDLPCDAGWWTELKLDGARGQLRVIDGAPALRTRRGRRCDAEFPEILAAAAGLPDVILDGVMSAAGVSQTRSVSRPPVGATARNTVGPV